MNIEKSLQSRMAIFIVFTMIVSFFTVPIDVSYAEVSSKNDYDSVCLFDLGSTEFQAALNGDREYLTTFSGGRFQNQVVDDEADYSYEWDVNGGGSRLRMARFFKAGAKISDYTGQGYDLCFRLKASTESGNPLPVNLYFSNTYLSNPGNHQASKTFYVETNEWKDYYMPLDDVSAAVIQSGDKAGYISTVLWQSGAAAEANSKLYIDEIFIGKIVPAGTELSVPVSNIDGKTSLSPDIDGDKTIRFTFEDLMDLPDESAIEVLKNGTDMPSEEYTVSLDEEDEKIIKITFANMLDGGANYKITLKENRIFSKKRKILKTSVVKEFISDAGSGFVIFNASALSAGSTVNATFRAEQGSTFYMTSYSTDGRILNSAPINDTSERTLTVPSDAAYVKAYILNASGTLTYYSELNPMGKINVSLGNNTSGLLTFEQAEGPVSGIDATGAAAAADLPVMITVTAPDGTQIVCEPISTDAMGSFEYNYTFDDSNESGMYKVKAALAGIASEYDLGYLKASEFLEMANGGNAAVLSAWMISKIDIFSQFFADNTAVADAAKIITENITYKDYDALYEMLERINGTVDKLSTTLWSDLSPYLYANADFIIDADSAEWVYFNRLTDSQKNLICQRILSHTPFNTISDFRTAFKNSSEEYEREQKDKENSKATGGPGGGGGRVTTSVTVTKPKSNENDVIDVKPDTVLPEKPFNDLTGFDWAEASVSTLFKKGIISKSANGNYRPMDNITREEFVTLIVKAFYPEAKGAEHRFTDEALNGWYNQVLSIAYELGIAGGRPDGSFGVGENISRQDMCVMLHRIMRLKGIVSEQADIDKFADSKDIADYAREALGVMVENGVIKGTDKNELSPWASSNRAQAACVIERMMNIMGVESE